MSYLLLRYSILFPLLVLAICAVRVVGQATQPATPSLTEAQLKYWSDAAREVVFIGDEAWSIEPYATRRALEKSRASADKLAPYAEADAPRYIKLRDGSLVRSLDEAAADSEGFTAWRGTVEGVIDDLLVIRRDGKFHAVTDLSAEDLTTYANYAAQRGDVWVTIVGKPTEPRMVELAGKPRELPTLRAEKPKEVKAEPAELALYMQQHKVRGLPKATAKKTTRKVATSTGFNTNTVRRTVYVWEVSWRPIPAAMLPAVK